VIDIDSLNFEEVINGMDAAVNGGAGKTAGIAALKGITVCGKTGTAQNPHGKEHSVFVAFAPREDPRIAIMVFVENAGFGASYAAPIASLMIEKYLRGEISNKVREKSMIDLNLMSAK
jgi:penicillin-binding protein 2